MLRLLLLLQLPGRGFQQTVLVGGGAQLRLQELDGDCSVQESTIVN